MAAYLQILTRADLSPTKVTYIRYMYIERVIFVWKDEQGHLKSKKPKHYPARLIVSNVNYPFVCLNAFQEKLWTLLRLREPIKLKK